MDHEVEDYRDIGPARLERREPLGLQKPRLVEVRSRRAHRAIESLDMPDLEAYAALVRRVHQLLGPRQRVGERLFDQRVETALEHRQRHFDVSRRRHDDGDGLDLVEQRFERRVGHSLQLFRHLRGACPIVIIKAYEIRAFDLLEQADVMEAEGSRPHDAHPDRPRCACRLHTITPRCEASMNCRNVSTSGTCGSSARARAMPWLTVRSELNTSR